MVEKKVIRDPIHGYIKIEKDILNEIVDDKHFQRLRRIEQTSMRCLYPAARHDRFIHSLGVYYLACLAVEGLETNLEIEASNGVEKAIPEEKKRNEIAFYFEMAALLHDVGHAPFSHTLENFFGIKKKEDFENREKKFETLVNELISEMKNSEVKMYGHLKEEIELAAPAFHEILSCTIMITCFKEKIASLAAERGFEDPDYEFMVRCIVGAVYRIQSDESVQEVAEKCYKNCMIRLLNSTIDVDKLDYIVRDSQNSGYDNVMVDTQRLLGALMLKTYKNESDQQMTEIVFKKSATNIIHDVINCRNSLYTWIYAHHKVQYEVYLIETAIKEIAKKDWKWFKKTFSLKAIRDDLLGDDDIWCKLKQYDEKIEEVTELLERNRQKKAIWKSFSEFEAYFSTNEAQNPIGEFSLAVMREKMRKKEEFTKFKKYLDAYDHDQKFVIKSYNVKLTNIKKNNIMIYVNAKTYSYDALFSQLYPSAKLESFFYVYSQEKMSEKDKAKLVGYIRNYKGFLNVGK